MMAQWTIETHPNPYCMTFHTRVQLTEKTCEFYDRGDTPENALALCLLLKPGITRVSVAPYELTVVWGKAFAREEIEPVVVAALVKFAEGAV